MVRSFGLVSLLGLVVLSLFAAPTLQTSAAQVSAPASAPAITNLRVNTPEVGVFDKFEVQFEVRTVATQPDLPFDANPPAGLARGPGVTIEGLFSRDNGATTLVQPAFLYQPYTQTVRPLGDEPHDHFVPNGGPHWVIRFAPQQAGAWTFKLRATDAGGSTTINGGRFTVAASSRNPDRQRGFLRVSQTDRRYFEFQDGSPFIGVGFNSAFNSSADAEQRLRTYADHKINFLRTWLSSAGINGSQWTSWSYHGASVNYLPATHLDTQTTFNGADVSWRLDDTVPCLFSDFWQGQVPVEPNAAYTISARVKLDDLRGTFAVKQGGWLEDTCADPNIGNIVLQAGKQADKDSLPSPDASGWLTLTGTYQNGDAAWLGFLYLARQGKGRVFVDEVRMWKQDDPNRINILREPNANAHLSFDPMNAAAWDDIITSAEQHGVYLKLVIDEKNEWIRNHIGPDGRMTSEATNNNDHFYAAPNTKVRWLMQAWWRYVIARWGYSTAIHSFELLNEGDPYNGRHYELANAFARYMHQHDPSRHMVTTSFWHSFPGSEFWATSELDYADLHAYLSTGWNTDATFLDAAHLETDPKNIRSGNGAAKVPGQNHDALTLGPRGLTVQGKGEWTIRYWMKAQGLTAACEFNTTGSQVRLRWQLDGGRYAGGQEGIVPPHIEGKDFVCTSPAGSFDWQRFSSDVDAQGRRVGTDQRLILTDDKPHAFSLSLENGNGTGGMAWIDDVEIVGPDGRTAQGIGRFDPTPMDADTAWYNRAYGDLLGAKSNLSVNKPVVRGEAGLDEANTGTFDRAILKDPDGVWLHNNVWGQINAGGLYDLFWWAHETIDRASANAADPAQASSVPLNMPLYDIFAAYRTFMADVPLNNGHYADASAQTSSPQLRAWGQRDDVNGRMHLWLQNTQYTWKQAVADAPIKPVSGTVTLAHAPGTYTVTWWDTRDPKGRVIATQTVTANRAGDLVLKLPPAVAVQGGLQGGLVTDVGVKLQRIRR